MIETIVVYAALGFLAVFFAGAIVTFVVGLWEAVGDSLETMDLANRHHGSFA